MRNFFSVIVGVIAGVIVIYVMESLSHTIFPLPEDVDISNPESVRELMSSAPLGALIFVIIAYASGSYLGGLTAAYVSLEKKVLMAILSGSVLMLFGLLNLIMLPHPIWFWFLSLMVYIPFALMGAKTLQITRKKESDST